MKLLLSTALFAVVALPALADNTACSLQFKDDLVIAPTAVQMQRGQHTLWKINNAGQLWLDNRPISTDSNTQQALAQYQAGLRQQSRATVVLVADALQLANDAASEVISGLGVNSQPLQASVNQAIAGLKTHIDRVVVSKGDEIHLYGSQINQPDGKLEREIEQAVQQSMAQLSGAVMMGMGSAMMQSNGNFEQQMADFGKKMANFGQQIEQQMQAKGKALEQRGQAICQQLRQLDGLEQQIQQAVPAMQPYDLIDTSQPGKQLTFKLAAD